MKPEEQYDITITVTTENEPSLAAVAQFLTGVVIMRQALLLGTGHHRAHFETRLRGLTSPLLLVPGPTIEACGSAWALLGDWPPMDYLFRGGVTQGLLEACETSAPQLSKISSGSLVCVFRRWLARLTTKQPKIVEETDQDDELEPKFAQAMADTNLLIGRPERGEFKDRMLETVNASAHQSGPASFLAPMLGVRRPEMLAVGTLMFACQSLEGSYAAMGARKVSVGDTKPRPLRSNRGKRQS